MDTSIDAQHRGDRGGDTTIMIRSFTDPRKDYAVSLEAPRTCECLHFVRTGARCRHILTATVIERIRGSKLSTSRDEEVAREIVARILDKTNRLDASYEAMTDAFAFRFSTSELKSVAKSRHRENIRRELDRIGAVA